MTANPTLFLTRPRPQAERFGVMCQKAIGGDVPVVISPLLQITPQDVVLSRAEFGDVILTSANGARALARVCDVSGLTAYCVGDQTAEVAAQLGMVPTSAHGAAEDLLGLIRQSHPKQPLLHARGAETRGNIAENLRTDGYTVTEAVLYAQVPCDLSAEALNLISDQKTIVTPLFSPRTAKLFSAAIAGSRAHFVVFPMSQTVADAISSPKAQVMQPPKIPTAQSLCDLIAAFYSVGSG